MNGEIEIYWVVLCKGGHPLYAVAGPFGLSSLAEDAMDEIEEPGTTCHLEVMSSKIGVFK